MASFDSGANAVNCSIAIQHAFDDHNQAHAEEPHFVRMGMI